MSTDVEDKIISQVDALIKRENLKLDKFFVFPKWFPTYQRQLYRRLCAGILMDLHDEASVRPTTPTSEEAQDGAVKRLAVLKQRPVLADGNLIFEPSKTLRVLLDQMQLGDRPTLPSVFKGHHIPLAHELAFLEYVACLDPKDARKELKRPDAFKNWQNQLAALKGGENRRKRRDDRKAELGDMWPQVRAYIQSIRVNDVAATVGKTEWQLVQDKFTADKLTEKEAQQFITDFKRRQRPPNRGKYAK